MAPRAVRHASWFAVAAILAALAPAVADAEPMAGITGGTTLVTFDSANPGQVLSRPITGLITTTETVIGLDTRPATGELFVLTVPTGIVSAATIRTYRVDLATAVATHIGEAPSTTTISNAGDRPSGLDFQPIADRVRVVQSNNANGRINPVSGSLAGDDTSLSYTAPATGPVVAVAYDRNVAPGPPGTPAPPGAKTTLYGIDAGADRLVVQGGIDGAAGGPSGGAITNVGPLGFGIDDASDAGFDISPAGTAYAALTSGGTSALWTVDLTSGHATLVGAFPTVVSGLTVTDNCPGVDGDQADLDGDFHGDVCDSDIDGDGVPNGVEQAIGSNPRVTDSDGDGKGDGADACPIVAAATVNGCPPALIPPDLAAPTVRLARVPSRITYESFLKGVKVKVTPGEPAAFDAALLGKARSTTLARTSDITLAERTLPLAAGTRSVTLRPKRALLGRTRRFTARLRVVATDAAKNRRVVTKTISVR